MHTHAFSSIPRELALVCSVTQPSCPGVGVFDACPMASRMNENGPECLLSNKSLYLDGLWRIGGSQGHCSGSPTQGVGQAMR
jgi:hypothetical protein